MASLYVEAEIIEILGRQDATSIFDLSCDEPVSMLWDEDSTVLG
jgi:hypothetical protein